MWCSDWGDSHGFDFFDFEDYKDHYKVLELNCDASDDEIRSSFIRLALKWHPDKFKQEDSATSRFQEINEAYQVLSDPIARQEYDKKRMRRIYEHNKELLNEYKELILTCNGLGMKHYLW
ncbi:putative DnaJ domain, Chaperone J-domain superfamily [Arabidopsis thaliana]|uniref:J domain-containing protein n=3 Tax=Arabidopsis TaxID=3701 RepID=A0A178VVK1_ARATH|nr:DnaJ domain [Arabidopsis thaliana x Arabidopsis arenosa]OAP10409.1 hypothetical protein AXX17_AT2G30220 [Arabidopsis thaliana]CAA0374420.1 unnamed protein product [Arabidopsis thaliana]